ncbi:TBC1 domain family member 30-like isoform X2 [Parasteatoda tepidariorum]|nr:TBC1 domain family member 30-like isoform X2 [Parasteatoda tepidariorum]
MKMVARLPDGIPPDFRRQLWLSLAKRHLEGKSALLEKAFSVCLGEKCDPDESELGTQIIKDLHRTGCSPFSGEVAQQNQTHLKRVLLAYAKWNPSVGYCQGFNMLAAIILEVVEWKEEDALLVMIFLIEEVLPESYFANHLRGLSVDMAVFRDLLRLRLSSLSAHLDRLQSNTQDSCTGHIYEPPLTNVFTMQWFLTLFTTCLPKDTVLRVWDLIFLEGNEVLLRAALAIWDGLADRIMAVESADEFYCIMGVLTREILEFGLMDADMFVKTMCTLAPFPFPQLQDLRDSYTYNIQPFTSSLSSDAELQIFSGEGDEDDEDLNTTKWYFSNELQWYKKKGLLSSAAIGNVGPGAYGASENNFPLSFNNFNTERMTLDISSLKKQYMKLRERQKQAHVILSGAFQNHFQIPRRNSLAVNHLLMGKQPLVRKKSHQPQFIFPERSSHQKLDASRKTKSFESEEDTCEESKSFPSQAVLPVGAISEPIYKFPAVNSLAKCCDSKVVTCKIKNHPSPLNVVASSDITVCNCSSSFTCPSHVSGAVSEKPSTVNPFPTKRRVGSMKNKRT